MPELGLGSEILEGFRRLGVALAIGLLIGIERGWKDRAGPEGSRTAGLRTFTLIGLAGGIAGLISEEMGGLVLALAFLGVAAGMTAFELQHARRAKVSDATPLVAALVVFLLGALAGLGLFAVAAAAAVATAVILAFKEGLHAWIAKITFEELRAGLALAAMTVIILPLLPSAPLDPWDAVSLRDVWLLTVLIAAVSFVGYAAIRILGTERGPLVAGIAGGLVSSTATVISIARMARRRRRGAPPILAGAVAANGMMFARIGVVAAALRPDFAVALTAALLPAALLSAAMAAWLSRRPIPPSPDAEANGPVAAAELQNPLALRAAVTFAILLVAVSLAAAAVQTWVGAEGVYALAAVAGLADVDAITLSMTQSTRTASDVAALAVLIAVAVNTVAKAMMAQVAGGPRVGLVMAITSAITLLGAAVGYVGYLRLVALGVVIL